MADINTLLEQAYAMHKGYSEETAKAACLFGDPVDIPWVDHLPVRIYLNRPAQPNAEKKGVFLNMHGGGFIGGDANLMGTFCQKLADALGILVVNVNYRLAPEYIWPYQCEELDVILEYLNKNADSLGIDMAHCGVGGFSAGASIALNSVVRALENNTSPYSCCVLGYPLVSILPEDIPMLDQKVFTEDTMWGLFDYYYRGRGAEPCCNALKADDALLARFPHTILITCGKDELGEQGRKLAGRLATAGATLSYREYPDALHGFIEVNRPDYPSTDPRVTPEQAAMNEEAEAYIIHQLKYLL